MEIPNEIGKWKKILELGSGSFGTVLLWRNIQTDECVAIKKCKFQSPKTLSAKQRERWNMEVNFMKLVDHPNVIKYKEVDPILIEFINKYNPSKMPILPMEYCTKGNLRKFITSKPLFLSGLFEIDTKCILKDIISGLKYLHSKNITHRDLKPENIVLQHSDERIGKTIYKIIDLGYAKELQDATLSFVGTLHYLAPEIFYGGKYDKAVDYWSIGIMAFELCCGVLPFLPEMTPFERFENIKLKEFNHICIYKSYSGAFTNLSTIKREHFLTNWFKENIETWFKYVFQLDPLKRVLVGDVDSLDYLENILQKNIMNIYNAYNCSFHSYEVTDNTLSSLQNWISKEINIAIDDLIFVVASYENDNELNSISFINDTDVSYLKQNTTKIYMFKKNAACNRPQIDLPNLLKELLKGSSKIPIDQIKPLYRQALFFTYKENEKFVELRKSYEILITHIKNNTINLDEYVKKATNLFNDCLERINKIKVMEGTIVPTKKEHYKDILISLETKKNDIKKLCEDMKTLHYGMKKEEAVINKIFDQCNVTDLLQKINNKAILETEVSQSTSPYVVILERIRKAISDLLRITFKFFNSNQNVFSDCVMKIWDLLDLSEKLKCTVEHFIDGIKLLSSELDRFEEPVRHIDNKELHENNKLISLNCNSEHSLQIIEENRRLREQLDIQLAKGIYPKSDDIDIEFDF
ncbi:hypothetical protein GWI33_005663 [Rhynchophorus ferrugineus]|uniref:IkappaB kinase n=1 Tax=Rhynchophorus ferrugineus TaxID=354439 RepID=A0A834ISM9_RHYFE|nr:hypothetical protein GWI33_005663 [Rhynchophorus ferrugineus]